MPDFCDYCQNTGHVACECGGDVCLCGAEEMPCPMCSSGYDYLTDAETIRDYLADDWEAGPS